MDNKLRSNIYEPSIYSDHIVPSTPIRNFRQLLATVLKCSKHEQAHQQTNVPGIFQSTKTQYDDDSTINNHKTSHDDVDPDPSIATIQPVGQLIQIEARIQDASSFNTNADLLCIFGDGRNRWLTYDKKPSAPPAPVRVPRLIMSPFLCSLWQNELSPSSTTTTVTATATPTSPNISPLAHRSTTTTTSTTTGLGQEQLMHLLIIQGLAASETRKFIAVETFHEAASTVLNELSNGYSVVFVGLMFKSEFENRMLQGKAYHICKSVEELRHWQNHIVMVPGGLRSTALSPGKLMKRDSGVGAGKELPDEPRRYLGIIC